MYRELKCKIFQRSINIFLVVMETKGKMVGEKYYNTDIGLCHGSETLYLVHDA